MLRMAGHGFHLPSPGRALVLAAWLGVCAGAHADPACASPAAPGASFRAAVDKVAPSVVQLVVLREHEGPPPEEEDAGVLLAPAQYPLPGRGAIERAISSGFFIGGDGELLTTAHAVEGASAMRVYTARGESLEPVVVGVDPGADLALLKVPAGRAPGLEAAVGPQVVCPGDWVAAIGTPFGFAQSASVGIVSSYPRSVPIASDYGLIQTDAAVNPGNSGGPLVDAAGRVVGVNAMIFSEMGGSVGMSFALPIHTALGIADALRSGRSPWRAAIGVHTQPLTASLARALDRRVPAGTVVAEVRPGGSAEAAGLRPGDVILSVDGQPAGPALDLLAAGPGTALRLAIWRQGREQSVTVRIPPARAPAGTGRAAPVQRLGLALAPSRHVGEIRRGVLVEEASGPGLLAGIVPGDRVCGIGGTAVGTRAEFDEALAAAPPGESVALLICRGSRAGYVAVERR